MDSTYEPFPHLIDPFILHFLSSTIEPPPPLPSSVFFYDPFLVVPPPPPLPIMTASPSSAITPPPSITTSPSSEVSPPRPKVALSSRHRYTPLQLFTLHRIFMQLPYPSLEQRRLIAEHLHIDAEQVRIWFSNRRSRKRACNHQTSLLQPTSNEHNNLKPLFDQLNLVI